MRFKLPGFFLFVCSSLLFASVTEAGISVTDNRGRVIDIAQPARRVIALAPHTTHFGLTVKLLEWYTDRLQIAESIRSHRRTTRRSRC